MWKLLLYLLMTIFVMSGAKAQMSIHPSPPLAAVCVDKKDAYALALADMQNTLAKVWEEFVKEGRCRFMPATYLFSIDSYRDTTGESARVFEMLVFGQRVWGLRNASPPTGVWTIRDDGQWEDNDPAIRQWYRTLMQPDNPMVSCCGESDAYYADKIVVRDGKTYAVITDDRDDVALNRPHIPMGTEILIPNHKLKWDKGNPTGHNVIFVTTTLDVYCFVQTTGI